MAVALEEPVASVVLPSASRRVSEVDTEAGLGESRRVSEVGTVLGPSASLLLVLVLTLVLVHVFEY